MDILVESEIIEHLPAIVSRYQNYAWVESYNGDDEEIKAYIAYIRTPKAKTFVEYTVPAHLLQRTHVSARSGWKEPYPPMSADELRISSELCESKRKAKEANIFIRAVANWKAKPVLNEYANVGRHESDPNKTVHYDLHIQSGITPTISGSAGEDRAYDGFQKELSNPRIVSVKPTLIHPARCAHGWIDGAYCSLCAKIFPEMIAGMRHRVVGGVEGKKTRTLAASFEPSYWHLFDVRECHYKPTQDEKNKWHAELVKANDVEWAAYAAECLARFEEYKREACSYPVDSEFGYWKYALAEIEKRKGIVGAKWRVAGELDGHYFDAEARPATEDNSAELGSSEDEEFEHDFGAGPGAHITYDGSRETTEDGLTGEHRKRILSKIKSKRGNAPRTLPQGRLTKERWDNRVDEYDVITSGLSIKEVAKSKGKAPAALRQSIKRLKE